MGRLATVTWYKQIVYRFWTFHDWFWAFLGSKRSQTVENARKRTSVHSNAWGRTVENVHGLLTFTLHKRKINCKTIPNLYTEIVSWWCEKLQSLMNKTLLRKQTSKSWGKKYRPRSALELYFRIFNCILLDHNFSWVKNKMILYSPYECFLHYVHQHHLRN